MTDDDIISVIQAHKEGRKIEFRSLGFPEEGWVVVDPPDWDFPNYDYRVAPEPRKPREWHVIEYPNGTIASGEYTNQTPFKVREVIG